MLRAVVFLLPVLAWSQITKPPEFEQPGAFRTAPAQSGLDGTSHVAAQHQRLSASLLSHLANLDLTGLSQSERDAFDAGRRLLAQSMGAAALQHFRSASEQHRECAPLRLGYAVTLYLMSKPDESAAQVLAVAGNATVLIPFLGELASASPGNAAAIEQRLRQFAGELPRNGAVRYYLAGALTRNYTVPSSEAEELLKEAAKLDPNDARPCLDLARLESNRDNTEAATGWVLEAIKREPDLAEAHYRLSRLYFRAGKQAESDRHLERFRELSKRKPQ